MSRINAVIFDLDNTLFDETHYIKAAHREIARFLSDECDRSEEHIYRKLRNDFKKKTSMYPRLFNDLLQDLDLDQSLLSDLLDIFATIEPNLELYSQADLVLRDLEQNFRLGLLTNGTVQTQRNKVKLLGIESYFDTIIYAREEGKEYEKPNQKAYSRVLQALNSRPENTVSIGDNPYTDFIGAKKLGIYTVRLLKGEYKDVILDDEYEAQMKVQSLSEFHSMLKSMRSSS